MLKRRALFGAAAAVLAAPAVRAQGARVLRFVPNVDMPVLDPVVNTASQLRNHGYLVFDTLYGIDASYRAVPQMVAGHDVAPDALTWTLTLRPGLMFHDGTPVLSRDVVASVRRWASVDGFGMTLMAQTDALEAVDDRTVRFRLRAPFPLLPEALGHMSPNMPAMMPERLARLTASKPVPEIVGSGPFRMVEAERVPGSRIVYERFAGYVPGAGPAGFTSGPKVARVDRIEWLIMPEPATAAAALRSGEVDWYEAPPPDLVPSLRQAQGVVVATPDQTGVVPILRFNTLHPPFDTVAIRRAVLSAVDQREFMQAFSEDSANWRTGVGCFCPGTPLANDAGLGAMKSASVDAARRAIEAAGYAGERVVMMEPTDHPVNSVMSQVGADLFKRLGLQVDDLAMDAATMFQRRANREDVAHGGWSCFPSAVGGIDVLNPAVSFLVRGDGAKAWYGWPADPALETLRQSWFKAGDPGAQQQIARAIQGQIMEQAPYVPLGQILQPTAYRKEVTGVPAGFSKFWGVSKA